MYVEPEELSEGLALRWKKEMGVQIMIRGKNIIEPVVRISGKSPLFRIFWVYGDLVFEERKKVWDCLKRNVNRCEGPVMCIRGFNDIA